MNACTPPRVSVVIPAFNAATFIHRTLESIRTQRFQEYEIVVVDDGSSDETANVVDRFLNRHGLEGRCLRQSNRGIAGARNAGIREARTKYIALLDHDDLWYPNKLRAVMAVFASHPGVDLVCHNEYIAENGSVVRVPRNGPLTPNMYERLLFDGNALSPSATTFKKEVALSLGGFREDPRFDTAEDYDFWLRLSRRGTLYFLDEVLGEYQVVERAASRRIVYHYTNLEHVVQDHFETSFGVHAGFTKRMRLRRRLSSLYRAAAGQLMAHSESPAQQQEFVMKMLRAFPFDSKNLGRATLWAIRRLRSRITER